ncbi:MAG: NUDIX hydrolase [Candidatus Pacearchaeota archaeon]
MEIIGYKNIEKVGEIKNEEVRGLIIFQYNVNNELCGELLLLKNSYERSRKNPEINLKWEIVGGRRALERNLNTEEHHSENIFRSILREISEETGLSGENINLVEPLGKIITKSKFNEIVSHLFKIVVLRRYEPTLTKEHIGYQWVILHQEIYKYDFNEKRYSLIPNYTLTIRTEKILDFLKENDKIKMYLPKKIGPSS